jgi:uncharacterized membrane-anchored protein YitT (DUF2179 family)
LALTVKLISHLLVLTGAAAIAIGAALIYVPAGIITGGIMTALYGATMLDVESPWRIEVKHR